MHNPRRGVENFGPGWYWVPAGATEPVYLATNSYDADFRLRQLADDAGDDAADAEPARTSRTRTLRAVAA